MGGWREGSERLGDFLPCSLYAEIKGITCTTPHHDFGAFYMISLYDLMTPKGASLVAQW